MIFFAALAFIGVPILEIAVFVEVGGRIGLGPTLVVVVATAFIGAALLRQQGLATLERVRHSLAAGRMPIAEVFDGLCLLLAGAFLLTPGFVTDGFGLLLFVPGLRAVLRTFLGRHLVSRGSIHVWSAGVEDEKSQPTGPVIEGDFHPVEETESKPTDNPPTETRDRRANNPKLD